MSQRITRTRAGAIVDDTGKAIVASARGKSWRQTHTILESEGGDNVEVPKNPEPPIHDQPSGKAMAANILAPTGGTEGASSVQGPKPVTARGKPLPQRSPLPGRTNRNTHPGLIVKPKTKRSTKEVTAAARRKVALQERVDDLERQRVQTIAEMDIQEERDEEAYDRSVVRHFADSQDVDLDEESSVDEEAAFRLMMSNVKMDQKVAYIPPSSESEGMEEDDAQVQVQSQVTPPKPKKV